MVLHNWLCWSRGGGLDDLQRPLPTRSLQRIHPQPLTQTPSLRHGPWHPRPERGAGRYKSCRQVESLNCLRKRFMAVNCRRVYRFNEAAEGFISEGKRGRTALPRGCRRPRPLLRAAANAAGRPGCRAGSCAAQGVPPDRRLLPTRGTAAARRRGSGAGMGTYSGVLASGPWPRPAPGRSYGGGGGACRGIVVKNVTQRALVLPDGGLMACAMSLWSRPQERDHWQYPTGCMKEMWTCWVSGFVTIRQLLEDSVAIAMPTL